MLDPGQEREPSADPCVFSNFDRASGIRMSRVQKNLRWRAGRQYWATRVWWGAGAGGGYECVKSSCSKHLASVAIQVICEDQVNGARGRGGFTRGQVGTERGRDDGQGVGK